VVELWKQQHIGSGMIKGLIASVLILASACGRDGSGRDGSRGEKGDKGDQGPAGENAILETKTCKIDWAFDQSRGQNLVFTVIYFRTGAIGSSLERTYYNEDYKQQQVSTVLRDSSDEDWQSARVGDAVAEAELISQTKALFTRKAPLEEREASCETK
jgi:hypothetical protein